MRGQEVVCPWPVIKSSMRVRKTIDRYGRKVLFAKFRTPAHRRRPGASGVLVSCNANARNISPLCNKRLLFDTLIS